MTNLKKASILKQKQNELIDEFILDTEKISKIMKSYNNKLQGFHNYSLGNLILASYQLFIRTGETVEQLASYKKWSNLTDKDGNPVNRHVKKGEKALYILAPIFKKVINEETGEEKQELAYYRSVPVFDLQQTEGEALLEDYTENNGCNLTFDEIKNRISKIQILESEKQITKGYTNGKTIHISKHLSDNEKICVLFHELAHYYLHFDENRNELDSATKELEAEAISFMVSSAIGITNHESGAYITAWAGSNSHELIQGKGDRLIKTASMIIDNLNLDSEMMEASVC